MYSAIFYLVVMFTASVVMLWGISQDWKDFDFSDKFGAVLLSTLPLIIGLLFFHSIKLL